MNNAEKKVAAKFAAEGYKVENLEPGKIALHHDYDDASPEKQSEAAEVADKVALGRLRKGCPDLLVYKTTKLDSFDYRVDEVFFVEVKTSNDGLKTQQLEWLSRNTGDDASDFDCYVAVVDEGISFYEICLETQPGVVKEL